MMNRLAAVVVVIVIGLTAFGAKAGTVTDNLQIEVNVTIIGTVDLTLIAAGSGVAASGGTSEAAVGNNTDADATSDKVAWTLNNPDLGETHTTGLNGYGTISLDNIGRKKVAVTAQVTSTSVDTGAAVGKWTLAAAPAVSRFGLKIKATAGASAPTVNATAFTDLGPASPAIVAPPTAAVEGPIVNLVSGFKKQHDAVQIDLEYKTPTDITDNNEFDGSHVVTITLAGAAD